MVDQDRLADLLLRWEEARQDGRAVALEELCRDCPELLQPLRQQIQALQAVDATLQPQPQGTARPSGLVTAAKELTFGGDAKSEAANECPDLPGYVILRELGRGGMGVVYLAQQIRLDRLVAVKMLLSAAATPQELVRFHKEVEAIARLQHPNLVQIHEVGEQDGRPYYVMEFVAGSTLEAKISHKLLPPREAAQLLEVLARTMHLVHEKGIVHRDLKPGNVLLTEDGVPKIMDFGLAKRLDGAPGPTLSGFVVGTPSYMAPEQAVGQNDQVGPLADVYALGAILYETITGRPPFLAPTAWETIHEVVSEDVVPPRRFQPHVPADLETICLKCLQKHPANRYASASALAEDLRRFLAHEPILARPVGLWQRAVKWARRRPAAAGLVGVSVLAGLLLLGFGWWFTHRLEKELASTQAAQQATLAAEFETEQALTIQVAERLDSDLSQLATVPQTMAVFLTQRADWSDAQLENSLRQLLRENEMIFGACVAFERGGFRAGQDDYARFVYRKDDGLSTKQLIPPEYLPVYREWDWYRIARETKEASWCEPYVGVGADRTPMVTYSVPFVRRGKVAGVVTADLSIAYFRKMHENLGALRLGPDSYCFVISQKGTFLYYPDPEHEFPAEASNVSRMSADASFVSLVEQMRREKNGTGKAIDFRTGRSAVYLFARVAATEWTFVVVNPTPVAHQH